MFSLVGHRSLLLAFSAIVPAYISFLEVCALISAVKFMQCLKNGVLCDNVHAVHMQVIPIDFINVIFFQGI